MSLRLIVRPEAEVDITEAVLWYETRESGMALKPSRNWMPLSSARWKTRWHICFFASIRMSAAC
jgi:hypothetical protein